MEEAPRRQRPASNAGYRERGFWDARYEQEGAEPTEWFGGLEAFREELEAELKPGDRILVLGCGNSALSYDLFQLGYTDITNIDYSAVCISSMQDRYAHCSGLHWVVMDARFLTFLDGSFDVVLEKGFLDSIMVEEKDLWNVSQEAKILLNQVLTEYPCGHMIKIQTGQRTRIYDGCISFCDVPTGNVKGEGQIHLTNMVARVLQPRGKFISITFAQPHFRKRHYAQRAYNWSIQHISYGRDFHYFLYVMKKGGVLNPSDLALGQSLHRHPTSPGPVYPLQEPDCENYLFNIQL